MKEPSRRRTDVVPKVATAIVVLAIVTVLAITRFSGEAGADDKQANVAVSSRTLFFDWHHVETGRLKPTFDPARLSDKGKAEQKKTQEDWNIIPDLSGHGMKRVKLAYGVRVAIEKARKSTPWLQPDQEWERRIGGYQTVIHVDGKFRCWYAAGLTEGARKELTGKEVHEKLPDTLVAYAESSDGFAWTKPALDVYKFRGKPTNLVTWHSRESAIFLDPSAPAEERYKSFKFGRLPNTENVEARYAYGLYGAVSPDGHHWKQLPEPLLRYFHDTQNIGSWDPILKKYVAYLRGHHGGRAIGRSETDDFRNWPPSRVFLAPGPEDAPFVDYYTNGFTWYPGDPSIRFLFSTIYYHDTDQLDVRIAVSRDNYVWNWISHDPIIELGRPGEWDSGSVYANPNLVQLPDGRIALPYSGSRETHNESFGVYKDPQERGFQTAWALWDEGRLAGIEATERGEFWSVIEEPFDGQQITVNARTTRVGRLEVELHEKYGRRGTKIVPGFSFEDCVHFSGDDLAARLQWKQKSDLSELRGKQLLVHFRLSSAKVFGFRIE